MANTGRPLVAAGNELRTAAVSLPKLVVSPNSKYTRVSAPLGLTLPLIVAVVAQIFSNAGDVVNVGSAAEVVNVIGDVSGKNVVIIDDMISTGGSMKNASLAAKERGALNVYAACTHAVFCGDAMTNLASADLREVVVTDTVPNDPMKLLPNIKILSVAPLLGEAARRIHEERSLSSLFV